MFDFGIRIWVKVDGNVYRVLFYGGGEAMVVRSSTRTPFVAIELVR